MKKLLVASIIMNIFLAGYCTLLYISHGLVISENKYIKERYNEDFKALNKLLVGRISKAETIKLLEDEQGFFTKREENVIGIGRLTLFFDNDNKLQRIEAPSFEGP